MQSTLRHNHIVTCCCRFTVSLLVEAFPRLKCIIDLTNTDRYYDEKVSRINVDSRRIFPPIHVITMSIKNATSRSSIRVFSSFGNWNREIPLLSSLRSLTAFLDRADIRELVAPLHWSRLIFVHLSFLFLSFLLPLTRSFARLRFPFLFSLFFFFRFTPCSFHESLTLRLRQPCLSGLYSAFWNWKLVEWANLYQGSRANELIIGFLEWLTSSTSRSPNWIRVHTQRFTIYVFF